MGIQINDVCKCENSRIKSRSVTIRSAVRAARKWVGPFMGTLLLLGVATPTFAQTFRTIDCTSNPALFNTAYNGINGPALIAGLDPVWESGVGTAAGGPASVAGWIRDTVGNRAPTAWIASPFGNANWISHYTSTHTGNVDIYHRYRFNMAAAVQVNLFQLRLDFYSDNSVAGIYVNGVLQTVAGVPQNPTDPYQYQGFRAGAQAVAVLGSNWQTGTNVLVVHVKSGQPYQGFLAQASGNPVCIPPTLTLSKITTNGAGGTFNFTLTNTAVTSGSATTAAADTAVQVDGGTAAGTQPFSTVTVGTGVTVVESAAAGWSLTGANCQVNSATVGSFNSATRTYSIPGANVAYGGDIVCNFTNDRIRADLSITKSNGASIVARGQQTTYIIHVNNNGPYAADGAVLRDPAPSGLNCGTGTLTCGNAVGGAVCPGSPTVAALQNGGVTIPTLPTGSSLDFALTCTVM